MELRAPISDNFKSTKAKVVATFWNDVWTSVGTAVNTAKDLSILDEKKNVAVLAVVVDTVVEYAVADITKPVPLQTIVTLDAEGVPVVEPLSTTAQGCDMRLDYSN